MTNQPPEWAVTLRMRSGCWVDQWQWLSRLSPGWRQLPGAWPRWPSSPLPIELAWRSRSPCSAHWWVRACPSAELWQLPDEGGLPTKLPLIAPG